MGQRWKVLIPITFPPLWLWLISWHDGFTLQYCEEISEINKCVEYNLVVYVWLVVTHFIHVYESFFLVLLTLAIALFTVQLRVATEDLKDSTDKLWSAGEKQFRADHRPKLFVGFFHAWNEGGSFLNSKNNLLSLKPGGEIYVAAQATNMGPGDAIILKSDFAISWTLPMSNPNWGQETPNNIRKIDWSNRPSYDGQAGDFIFKPAEAGKWVDSAKVPKSSRNLYVSGLVYYRDTIGNMNAIWFARKYDRRLGRFVAVQDENYNREE
jgi:hypothetical protein